MSSDDDFGFDFFEEGADEPDPAPTSRMRIPRPSGRGAPPRDSGPKDRGPILRLLAIVVCAIVIGFFVLLGVGAVAGTSSKDEAANYMTDVTAIAQSSSGNGKALSTILTTEGLTAKQINAKIEGVAAREQQNIDRATALDPPGKLRDEHLDLIESLEFRKSGLNGLASTFAKITCKDSTSNASDAQLLADQADRLLTSDIVWDDLFKDPSIQQLQADNITGVSVPDSQFLDSATSSATWTTAAEMEPVVERVCGVNPTTPTGGETGVLRGTNIISTGWTPGSNTLVANASTPNVIVASTALAITVTVEDSGSEQEVQIPVTITIASPGGTEDPITKTQTIEAINPGDQVTLSFGNIDIDAQLGRTDTVLTVDVGTVPGEANASNNTATYPVSFALPSQ